MDSDEINRYLPTYEDDQVAGVHMMKSEEEHKKAITQIVIPTDISFCRDAILARRSAAQHATKTLASIRSFPFAFRST